MVVVTGEKGHTYGKEGSRGLVMPQLARRARGTFVAVNLGRYVHEGLFASDLFGQRRRRVTLGAVVRSAWAFSARLRRDAPARRGRPRDSRWHCRRNLVRVLEMSEVRPVGGTRDVATDVRVIATSNRE